ncbi:MAG: AcidPPc domain-containing protein [Xylanivirga thermophila]|jgi:hypothetical protein|uniref:hypothetical protein n=1 Tax=Xylanivirga thermophila TaxID=2496273 RepID=UPI00101E2181|nr:hypothetical protein [Xylanivirga thermophila]
MKKQKLAKFISVLTVVPIMAGATVTWVYFMNRDLFVNPYWYLVCIGFLVIIPILAYPLKNLIPSIKKLGRKGERKLAFIMGVLGYVLGTIVCYVYDAPQIVKKIFLSYLVSGLTLSFFNLVLKIKASGHACGVSGPLTIILYYIGGYAWWAIIVIPMVFWARINLKRHTYKELFLGTTVGALSTAFVLFNL